MGAREGGTDKALSADALGADGTITPAVGIIAGRASRDGCAAREGASKRVVSARIDSDRASSGRDATEPTAPGAPVADGAGPGQRAAGRPAVEASAPRRAAPDAEASVRRVTDSAASEAIIDDMSAAGDAEAVDARGERSCESRSGRIRESDPRDVEIAKLRKINAALIARVERSTDSQGSAFSLFQTAIGLEAQVRRRTQELTSTLADLERSNLELKRARDVAVEANRSKTRFLAAASHDVLQPLNAALLLISSLDSVQTGEEGKRLCAQVERSLGTMDALLRTLLYMSRLDAGDVQPQWQSVSLDALFASIASDFEPTARQRGLELRVRTSGLHVRSDPTMLRRILQNIVTNALRYTERGGVLLIAGRRGADVHVRVADTGVGIARERFGSIFVEFDRCGSPSAHDDASSGLGLGLAIVERMVRTLDHEITLNSRVGHGSCFGLTMPLTRPPRPVREKGPLLGLGDAGAASSLVDARILVIENDLVALQALEALLRQWGCRLRLASSTAEAVDAIAGGAWLPDIVVADQHLDGKDRGTTTVRMVRAAVGQEIPGLIVTAAPSPALVRAVRRARLELMGKPLKPAQLRALLMHLRNRATLPVSA